MSDGRLAGRVAIVTGVPGDALAVAADVALEEEVERYATAAVERFGRIDLHHLNAGIPGTLAPLPEVPTDDFDRVLAVNVRGMFLGLRAAFRQFAAQGGGARSSRPASIASLRGSADLFAYHASSTRSSA